MSVTCESVQGSEVIVRTGPKKTPIFYKADLKQFEQLGDLFYSKSPQSPFYVSPQKRLLLRQYISFLTPANIKRYLVDFVQNHIPCSVRRVYYICTNFCRKFPDLTTYKIQRRDMVTGELIETTIVLWEEYMRNLKAVPRDLNDCFQRRKRRPSSSSDNPQFEPPKDIVLCRVGPNQFVPTASVQIVFLQGIHQIQLLDQIPRWLPMAIEDQRMTIRRRNEEVARCVKEGKVYRRRALNPVKLSHGAPVQSFTASS